MKKKPVLVLLICLLTLTGAVFAAGAAEGGEKTVAICTPYMSSVTTKQDVDILSAEFESARFSE